MSKSNTDLINDLAELEAAKNKAASTINPFQKAQLAEQAVGAAVGIIKELVNREIERNG